MASSRVRDSQSSSPTLSTHLYPISNLVEDVLSQEGELWTRNESMLQSLRVPAGNGAGAEDFPDRDGSMTSLPTPTPSEPGTGGVTSGHLIKYGQLTGTIHSYFRKLEKRHACLHLTARRAKHDTLRHVERSAHSEGSPDPHMTSDVLATESVDGSQQVELRDDERLVYRCALMCAQFPMLSAPDPPDGHSPSPPLPPLPSTFDTGALGSLQEGDLARTAPADVSLELAGGKAVENGLISEQGSNSHIAPCIHFGTEPLKGPLNNSLSLGVTDGSIEEVDMVTTALPKPSDPIQIKGTKSKSKTRSIKRSSKLPAVDSDSDDEVAGINSSLRLRGAGNGKPGAREHPFSPMVNREMLTSLVRRSFHQTEEQQMMFEQALRQEHSRRTKGEILAKELAGQLQVLENNAHPFYKPKFFVTRNGYDLWLQAEKQRVKNLIDKFWHFTLPRPQLWRHYNPTDYHRAYSTLLQKVISSESRTNRREPVHSGSTPSSPLSPTSHRLLTEFGLRYGVGELYRRIVYLDYLAKHFDYEIWYICHCTDELRAIRSLLPRNRNKITAVRREMEMLRATVHLFHGQADNSLTRIDRLFLDSDPKEGVAMLIELLAEVLDAEQTLFGKKVATVEHWLKRYLKSGFVLRYERRKVIAADETVQSGTTPLFVLAPTLVNSLLLDTRDEVLEYRDKYQDVFRQYFDIVPFAKLEFYRLLCADACSLCAGLLHRPDTRVKMSLDMLGLMYRLNERDLEWEGVVSPGLQLWRRHFADLALVWMEVLGKQIYQWVVESVAKDQWTLLTFSAQSRQPTPYSPSRRPSPKITSTIRTSPFPSPNIHAQERRSAFSPSPFSRSSGAFVPYKLGQLLQRTEARQSPSEEGSGAVTDSSSSQTTLSIDSNSGLIGGGIPKMMGLSDKSTDSLLNFGQDKTRRGSQHEHNVTEGSISVCSGFAYDQDSLNLCQISPAPPDRPDSPLSGTLPVEIARETGTQDSSKVDSQVLTGSAPIDVVATVLSNRDYVENKSNIVVPDLTVVHSPNSPISAHYSDFDQSMEPNAIGVAEPPRAVLSPSIVSDGSIVRPKPTGPPRPESGASLGTVPSWEGNPPPSQPEPLRAASDEFPTDEFSRDVSSRPFSDLEPFQSYLFPVSNSPIDIVTMLSRLASFTGTILSVLTPRLPRGGFRTDNNPSHEYAPEVAQAREQAQLLWTNAENNKTEFLKKMHRIMLNALKLYADNLLCMDLCCFSGGEAIKLVGEQKLEHLKRRKMAGDIWGCRHMVEAKHGHHPNGMPCQKKATNRHFESITRDMCIRINNIHSLISTFPSLEGHLYSCMRTSIAHQASAFGYISSDQAHLSPHLRKAYKPNPHSTRPPSANQKDSVSLPSSIDTSLGPMEPDGGPGKKELPDVGFRSKDSQNTLEYLQATQKCQLKLIALRMNKFFKPALSLLLELKLVNYPINKRLLPLLTFLERHRLALQKYLYPSCFQLTMEYMWECSLQDLEAEGVQLRTARKPVTDRAQMLLQTLSMFIEFMHDKGQGLSIDLLTGSSEYLLGLLDIMTRSTDQLFTLFNKLSAPQFSRNHFDLSRCPVPVDTRVLQCLRNQLHKLKKCFSGKEFVDRVLEIGQLYYLRHGSVSSTSSTPVNTSARAGISTSGQPVEYTVRYATQLGQFLLREAILIELPTTTSSLSREARFTPVPISDDETSLGANFEQSDGLSSGSQSSVSSQGRQRRRGGLERQATYNSYIGRQRSSSELTSGTLEFYNTLNVFYKFSDSEDAESNSLYKSHILAASVASNQNRELKQHLGRSGRSRTGSVPQGNLRDEHEEFTNARQGTLFLVYDLLVQRGRKERRAKQFLQLPRALEVAEQKRRKNVNCDLIFKI